MLVGIATALLAAVPAIADPSQIQHKQAQADSVLARIDRMNETLGRAVESYNLANVKLAKIKRDLSENARELRIAKSNLEVGRQHVAARVVQLYTSGGDTSTVDVILGAQNLDDLLTRLDTASRVSSLDSTIVKQVRTFESATKEHAAALRKARTAQTKVVGERAAKKRSIEAQLAQLTRLEASIKDQLARMRQAERQRQLMLARQAQARLKAYEIARDANGPNPTGAAADSGATPDPNATPAPPPSQYGGVVGEAMSQLGKPYVWGAAGPDAFDCSGLVAWAFAQLGVSVPHSSYALAGMGAPVSRDQLQPGDLVFFDGNGHVGIYIGGGQFVHAPHTGDVVKISSLSEGWYSATYVGARRIG